MGRRGAARPWPRARIGVAASVLAASVLVGPAATAASSGGAAETAVEGGGLVVAEARIEGSGPWTAPFGGRPHRQLVLTVVNAGATPVEGAVVTLATGRGADPATPLPSPEIGRVDPGESVTVPVDFELPLLAIGTYAVEGSIGGAGVLGSFRAETSHVPWLLVLAPLLVLVQLGLVAVRNLVRRRIFGTPVPPADPPPGPPPDLAAVIVEELDAVFDRAMADDHGRLDDADLAVVVIGLADRVARRVADRVPMAPAERRALHDEVARNLLQAFGLAGVDARSGHVAGSAAR